MPNINPVEAFSGGIKRPGVGPLYTFGLIAVTAVMAILPIIYIALIAGVIYATYYHATHHFGPIMGTGPRVVSARLWVLKIFIYGTPIFMGTVLAFFMVKPFFARRISEHQPYALNPESEPVLYDFIRRVCAIVGAPMPSLIELDCRVNASASLRHGFRSFFGRDLALTIGLPLVAGLTTREFAGVLAHEFGHFTQGTAMRLDYIINRIDGWFARLIWERDAWDEWLIEMANDEEAFTSFLAMFAQLGVWFSRKILFVLMLFGHAFSCFLSRRMEFHADQFEIRLAGSAAFESVNARLNTLNILHEAALQQMQVTWNLNKRLPDNLPQFIVNMESSQLGTVVRKSMKGQLGFVKTGLFHTHPSDAERVREARLANAPGIVTIDAPATELFENFPVPARIVTTLVYEGIGLPLGLARIYEVEVPQQKQAEEEPDANQSAGAAVDRFFSGIVTPLRPIFPGFATKISDAQLAETLGAIDALPAQIAAVSEQVAEACARFDRADQMMLSAAQEDAGVIENLDVNQWREEREQARRSLRSVLEAHENRFASALVLAETAAFSQVSRDAANIRRRVESSVRQLQQLRPLLNAADSLRVATAGLVRQTENTAAVGARLREAMADLEALMRDVPSPWEAGNGSSLSQYFRALPAAQEPFVGPQAETLAALPMAAYTKTLGDLVELAEQIVEQLKTRKVMRVQPA